MRQNPDIYYVCKNGHCQYPYQLSQSLIQILIDGLILMIYTSEPGTVCLNSSKISKESWYLYLNHSIQNVINQEKKNTINYALSINNNYVLISIIRIIYYLYSTYCMSCIFPKHITWLQSSNLTEILQC